MARGYLSAQASEGLACLRRDIRDLRDLSDGRGMLRAKAAAEHLRITWCASAQKYRRFCPVGPLGPLPCRRFSCLLCDLRTALNYVILPSGVSEMKAWVQRVLEASVSVDGRKISEIGRGYLVLLGVTHDDTDVKADELASKIATLRIFEDDCGKVNRSLLADVAPASPPPLRPRLRNRSTNGWCRRFAESSARRRSGPEVSVRI